ncbi:TraI/MobA(P) family conjugative relaxase [Pseudomonas oryzihabitans]|uniref:TraI/MobA(P) family conjugative relaxase n=1 Tax=Pseudomonas oryzihabitans TaxID=47885 RepID=UPI002894184F|nr:TraI/MobA(P) family conjugative relaxase [Pseudomonas oryzihabitans]MDT3723004.1 TraI/MobA(P) family conjugative relaxase [Pseudomonas oryzihabitans]
MIGKIGGRRGDGKTSFRSLSKYINSFREVVDPDTGEVSLGSVAVETNCLSEGTAWIEMWGTSVRSTRTKDPVMHLVISWSEGESPTDKQAFDAGRFALSAIGLEGHEYLSAVHRDTDNAHLHIMVNKVHPETHRVPKMSFSKFALDKAMRQIEIDQDWKHDNGPFSVMDVDGRKSIDWTYQSASDRLSAKNGTRADLPEKARQHEVYTGNESLAAYAKAQPKKDAVELLKSGNASWSTLHAVLARHGLEFRPSSQRNSSFYVVSSSDTSNIQIKASDMGLGGGKLIKQLGPYEPLQERYLGRNEEEAKTYNKYRPLHDPAKREEARNQRAKDRAELRSNYDQFVAEWRVAKAPARAALSERQKLRGKALTEQHKAQREAIKRSGLDSIQRKALSSVAAFNAASERSELKAIIKAENAAFRKEKYPSYRDWIADRAETGDPAAIAQLRGFAYADKRKGKHARQPEAKDAQRPYFASSSDSNLDPARPIRLSERVTWAVDRSTGDVDYLVNNREAFRDEGRRITFNNDSRNDADSIEVGLLLAKEKFGAVSVHGGQEFRDRVLATAVERRLDVRFADPVLEQQRKDAIRACIEGERVDRQPGAASVQPQITSAPQPPVMTREEAEQQLASREPIKPIRDHVEMDAIDAEVMRYRSNLDHLHCEDWGDRPDPEAVTGFIRRHMAKARAIQWDKEYGEKVELPTAVHRDYMNSDHPDAVKFRDDAWNIAINKHWDSVYEWTEKNHRAELALMTKDIWMPATEGLDDQRASRQAEAQRLRQRQEEQEQEQERERRNSLNRNTPDLDM